MIAAVDEADIGEVALGQRATFTVNAYPDRVFEGVVTEVRNSPVVVQDVVTYGTIVEVDNLDLAFEARDDGVCTGAHGICEGRSRASPARPCASCRPERRAKRIPPSGCSTAPPSGASRSSPGSRTGEITEITPGAIEIGHPVLVELTPEGRKAHGLTH